MLSIRSALRSTDCLYWFLQLLEARQSVLAEYEVGLRKCASIDLMSDEEDGIVGGVSGWIVRPPSFRSQELTELCATLQSRLVDSKVQSNAPQTSAKWTEFRQNAASYLQLYFVRPYEM